MSLVFSDTTGKDGIIQTLERRIYGENGDGRISGNATLLAMFTGDINLALDRALALIFEADGTWQFDDSNHTDYPIITQNLVSGQQDYPFTTDGSSNLILDIAKVVVAADSGIFNEVTLVDQQTEVDMQSFWDGNNAQGTPTRYDLTANGIFLDPAPNYNETNGLKVFISREGSYFATGDTTKKPGVAGLFHEYFVLYPEYKHAITHNAANAGFLREELDKMEDSMVKYYGGTPDESFRLEVTIDSNK